MAFDRARQQLASGQDTRLSRRCLTTVMSVTLAMGGGVEIAQTLMDMGRGGDIYDFIADAAGALLALASHSRVNRYFLGK
jgi:VanZ family protein